MTMPDGQSPEVLCYYNLDDGVVGMEMFLELGWKCVVGWLIVEREDKYRWVTNIYSLIYLSTQKRLLI